MKENNVCADLAFKRSIGTEYRYLGRSHRLPRGCTIGCSSLTCFLLQELSQWLKSKLHISAFFERVPILVPNQLGQVGRAGAQAASHTPSPLFHCRFHSFHHLSPDKTIVHMALRWSAATSAEYQHWPG